MLEPEPINLRLWHHGKRSLRKANPSAVRLSRVALLSTPGYLIRPDDRLWPLCLTDTSAQRLAHSLDHARPLPCRFMQGTLSELLITAISALLAAHGRTAPK